jgi:hypothetical protein
LELITRVPYQSWEQVTYIAITHNYERTDLAERIHDRVREARAQQDNEQWHRVILKKRIARQGIRQGWLRFVLIPQVAAFIHYQLSWLLYVIRPAWSYRLDADFEDHAEHECMAIVAEHPEWETEPFASDLASPTTRSTPSPTFSDRSDTTNGSTNRKASRACASPVSSEAHCHERGRAKLGNNAVVQFLAKERPALTKR